MIVILTTTVIATVIGVILFYIILTIHIRALARELGEHAARIEEISSELQQLRLIEELKEIKVGHSL